MGGDLGPDSQRYCWSPLIVLVLVDTLLASGRVVILAAGFLSRVSPPDIIQKPCVTEQLQPRPQRLFMMGYGVWKQVCGVAP
jgi:hypothetical protein